LCFVRSEEQPIYSRIHKTFAVGTRCDHPDLRMISDNDKHNKQGDEYHWSQFSGDAISNETFNFDSGQSQCSCIWIEIPRVFPVSSSTSNQLMVPIKQFTSTNPSSQQLAPLILRNILSSSTHKKQDRARTQTRRKIEQAFLQTPCC